MIVDKTYLNQISVLEKKVFVTGAFNLYHPGHAYFLTEAKKFGQRLIVAVAHDDITSQKRVPVLNQAQRMYIVNSHKNVDYVVPEDNEMPPHNVKDIIDILRPNYWVTNSDNPNLDVYREIIRDKVTEMVVLERNKEGIFDISTTSIIENILKSNEAI